MAVVSGIYNDQIKCRVILMGSNLWFLNTLNLFIDALNATAHKNRSLSNDDTAITLSAITNSRKDHPWTNHLSSNMARVTAS